LLLALLLSGCVAMRPQSAVIFDDGSWPLEYRSDLGPGTREVRGEACHTAVGLPLFLYGGRNLVGWGEAGFRDAVQDAQSHAPGATLSDLRADVRFLNILIFRRECIEVTAAAR